MCVNKLCSLMLHIPETIQLKESMSIHLLLVVELTCYPYKHTNNKKQNKLSVSKGTSGPV